MGELTSQAPSTERPSITVLIDAETKTSKPSGINEDQLIHDAKSGTIGAFDGISRSGKGNYASEKASQEYLYLLSHVPIDAPVIEINLALDNAWRNSLAELDNLSKDDQLGTTMAVVKLGVNGNKQKVAVIAWAGDTRVYSLKKDGSIKLLTRDHITDRGLSKGILQFRDTGYDKNEELITDDTLGFFCVTDGVFVNTGTDGKLAEIISQYKDRPMKAIVAYATQRKLKIDDCSGVLMILN